MFAAHAGYLSEHKLLKGKPPQFSESYINITYASISCNGLINGPPCCALVQFFFPLTRIYSTIKMYFFPWFWNSWMILNKHFRWSHLNQPTHGLHHSDPNLLPSVHPFTARLRFCRGTCVFRALQIPWGSHATTSPLDERKGPLHSLDYKLKAYETTWYGIQQQRNSFTSNVIPSSIFSRSRWPFWEEDKGAECFEPSNLQL